MSLTLWYKSWRRIRLGQANSVFFVRIKEEGHIF